VTITQTEFLISIAHQHAVLMHDKNGLAALCICRPFSLSMW